MDSAKLKNFIIMLLLLLNLFFLLFVVYQEGQSRRYEAAAQEDMVAVLQKNGIAITADVVPWEQAPPPLMVTRDREREADLAQNLLGQIQEESSGDSGVVVTYVGERGSLQFSRGGEFSLRLQQDQPVDGALASHTLSLLEKLDFQGLLLPSTDQDRVMACQTLNGYPVFTCQAEAVYAEGTLVRLEGSRLAGTAVAYPKGDKSLKATTLLLRFLHGVQERELTCGEIYTITPGYLHAAGLSSYVTLAPAWQLETDGGDYILNCATGELTVW